MLDNIILIGFMGCGKTTFGTWIAKNKKMDFCDTDALIVEKEKKSINDIFSENGETYFRELETEIVSRRRTSAKAGKQGVVKKTGYGRVFADIGGGTDKAPSGRYDKTIAGRRQYP